VNSIDLEDRHTSGLYHKRRVVLVRGEGATVWDEDGRPYIDCTTGIGVASLGHGHPVILNAIADQASRLITCHELFYNDARAALLECLNAVTPPAIDRFFLCNSGTEANEGAIKFARRSTGRREIIAMMRGYHGKTMGSLSATWDPKFREPFEPLVPEFRFIPYDNPQTAAEAISERTAAVIVEIVQGEGGVRPGSTGFFQRLRELCTARGALLIVDEVQTGFARTGRMFAFEHHAVVPDILTLAKSVAGGLPMGIIAFGDRVRNLNKLTHTTTFGGNPLVCAVARQVIDYLVTERIAERAAELGDYLITALRRITSTRVRQVRGLGLMVGIELKEPAGPFAQKLVEHGVLVLLAGTTVLRLLPPLIIEREQIDLVVETIATALT
jgi:acetylornithine/LysW-gamma-L-lysine aminotransferase